MSLFRSLNEFCLYAVALVFIWCCFGCATPDEGLQDQPSEANGILIEEFSSLMNAHRESVGCPSLAWREDLAEVAQGHSVDMDQKNYFSHVDPSGSSPFDRMALAEIDFSSAGENILLASEATPQQALDLWLASPGHKANIENCAFTDHGVGLEDGYWTHMFMSQ